VSDVDPSGKNVLITGSARGIGFQTARKFLRAGASVILTDVDEDALDVAEADLEASGTVLDTYSVDVSDRDAVEEMAEDVLEKHGRLDVLVNNAGIAHHEEITETSVEEWETVFGVNFFGPLYHIYSFLPDMLDRGEGHIVNISSGQAFFLLPTWGAYATSKLALGGFSEVLHHELRKHDINVTTVYPYVVNTGFYEDVGIDSIGSQLSMKFLDHYAYSPEEIAEKIFTATRDEKKSEMTSFLNWAGYYMDLVPGAKSLFTQATDLLMSR
jgi:NAD(P)-dependent dehydrogenase (short-subunit alcohol dehydrogenase family)